MPKSLNVLFLAAEAEPFIKIGGLADVAGTLPLALRMLPFIKTLDVRLVLPLHRSIKVESTKLTPIADVPVMRDGRKLSARIFAYTLSGMPVYFIGGDLFSNEESVYSIDSAADREKYSFFSIAALEMLSRLKWKPDIIHANDWHTALALYKAKSQESIFLPGKVHTLLTVHNLPYMGGEGTDVLLAYGLKPAEEEILPRWARSQPLPLGLLSADAIIPVSPTYAEEILTPNYGCGLEGFLRTREQDIAGILNGLDIDSYNPAIDKDLRAQFDPETLDKRNQNKAALQEKLELPINPGIPIFAMVGRIDYQKGVDIALNSIATMDKADWQFVILGSGDAGLESTAKDLQTKFPDQVRAVLRYDAILGRMIYGGADIFLMPSRYEPCGLAQMIAMRYGCVPVVRATGGLKDTVREGETGFLFQEATPAAMLETMSKALSVYSEKDAWRRYQTNCMAADFSWRQSAILYARKYLSLIEKG